MFIFYHPETRDVQHVVLYAAIDYRHHLETENITNWVETDEDIAYDEIEVLPDLTIARRQRMIINAPTTINLGETAEIVGVPEGVSVHINEIDNGLMDDSGVIEFTPETGGLYRFSFKGSGYIAQEITIEAIG